MRIARGRESERHRALKRQVVEVLLASGKWFVAPEHRFADVAAVSLHNSDFTVAFEVECANLRGFLGNVGRNKKTGFSEQWIVVTSTLARTYVESTLETQSISTRCFVRGVILRREISEAIRNLHPRNSAIASAALPRPQQADRPIQSNSTSKP